MVCQFVEGVSHLKRDIMALGWLPIYDRIKFLLCIESDTSSFYWKGNVEFIRLQCTFQTLF